MFYIFSFSTTANRLPGTGVTNRRSGGKNLSAKSVGTASLTTIVPTIIENCFVLLTGYNPTILYNTVPRKGKTNINNAPIKGAINLTS